MPNDTREVSLVDVRRIFARIDHENALGQGHVALVFALVGR